MTRYRDDLPQLHHPVFLTDGGIETSLIHDQGQELPEFAAFHLLSGPEGTAALDHYFAGYVRIARRDAVGIVLETPTWRANPDWGDRLGYDREALARANRRAVALVEGWRTATPEIPVVVSGCVGPRGDGYVVDDPMSVDEARRYHAWQVSVLANTTVDQIGAITMTYAEEAIGVTLAARDASLPVAISFTVETDGALPSGQPLGEAIEQVDDATDGYPAYFALNCAHPTHLEHALDGSPWTARLRGLRANASASSHAELDEATELDTGDPEDLASRYAELRRRLPGLSVLGGCCGTNHRHIDAISRACVLSGAPA